MKVDLGIPEIRETEIPSRDRVKFYQVGSYAVGNRLADVIDRSIQSDPHRYNSLTSGHRACQGCGEALGARYALDTAMDAADGDLVAVNATGCLEVFSTPYPESAWTVPWLHSLFGNAPAVATGVAAALRAKGKSTRVVAQGGDGGTVDIGMGTLSGMFERNDDVLYICYDNEAYMNTGVQRSAATPPTARTATTQAVGKKPGNPFGQGKDMARIAMAHEIPYVATATVADLRDLEYKVRKAMTFSGARYLHILVPCPLGWGSLSNETIKLARLATQTGFFPVFEAEAGEVTSVSKIRRPAPVEEYLKGQRRFASLFRPERDEEALARLQAICDRNIRRYGLIEEDLLDEDVLERIIDAPEDPEGRYASIRQAASETKRAQAEVAFGGKKKEKLEGETLSSVMRPEYRGNKVMGLGAEEGRSSTRAGSGSAADKPLASPRELADLAEGRTETLIDPTGTTAGPSILDPEVQTFGVDDPGTTVERDGTVEVAGTNDPASMDDPREEAEKVASDIALAEEGAKIQKLGEDAGAETALAVDPDVEEVIAPDPSEVGPVDVPGAGSEDVVAKGAPEAAADVEEK